jgi:D-xylose transport system substrate-binding protein
VGTVFKPFQLEADAGSKLAIDLANGKKPTFSKKDTYGVPFQALNPIVITKDNVQEALDKGAAKYSDVCSGDTKAACDKAGIKAPKEATVASGGRAAEDRRTTTVPRICSGT